MGQNLSLAEPFADTSGATLSAADRANDIVLAAIWGGSLYGVGMIWSAVGLLRRWARAGPDDGDGGGGGAAPLAVLAALLVSTGWPVVLAYFAFSDR
ncbi:hypothetical protein VTH06DRAFT_6266 [Thermothelomyces fergusii]